MGCCEFRAKTTKVGKFCTLRMNNDEQVTAQRDTDRQGIAEFNAGEGTHVRRRNAKKRMDTKSTMCFGVGATQLGLCGDKREKCPDGTYVEEWPQSSGECKMADCPEPTPLVVCPQGCKGGFNAKAKQIMDKSHPAFNTAQNPPKAVVCELASGKCVAPRKTGQCKKNAEMCMPVMDVQVCPNQCIGGYGDTNGAGQATFSDELLCENPSGEDAVNKPKNRVKKGLPKMCYRPHFLTGECNLKRTPCRCNDPAQCTGPTDGPTARTSSPTLAPVTLAPVQCSSVFVSGTCKSPKEKVGNKPSSQELCLDECLKGAFACCEWNTQTKVCKGGAEAKPCDQFNPDFICGDGESGGPPAVVALTCPT